MTSISDKPKKFPPKITSAPKIRDLYWCDFPKDAQFPEFWKRRPVIILSYRLNLYGAATIIPCSTSPQDKNKWAYKLNTRIDDQGGYNWAICDKITTVAVSRLSSDRSGVKRVSETEFSEILKIIFTWLPKIPKENS